MQKNIKWAVGIAVLVLALWWMYANRIKTVADTMSATPPITIADPSRLAGLQTGDAPWIAEVDNLAARLAAVRLPQMTMEGEALHIHQHLTMYVNGQPVGVPANIGINQRAGWLSAVHVHDDSGVIHVESPYVTTFTLGQFFDVWGVRFTNECIGGYCADDTKKLRLYVNGELYQGDLRTFALGARQELTIVFGTDAQVPKAISTSYHFPKGY